MLSYKEFTHKAPQNKLTKATKQTAIPLQQTRFQLAMRSVLEFAIRPRVQPPKKSPNLLKDQEGAHQRPRSPGTHRDQDLQTHKIKVDKQKEIRRNSTEIKKTNTPFQCERRAGTNANVTDSKPLPSSLHFVTSVKLSTFTIPHTTAMIEG